MKIYVDGDSCPRLALQAILKASRIQGIALELVADRHIRAFEEGGGKVSLVDKGSGDTDPLIIGKASTGDLVITRDLYLARELLGRSVSVMNDRGILWDKRNLENRIEDSQIMMAMRAGSLVNTQSYHYDKHDARNLYDALISFLEAGN